MIFQKPILPTCAGNLGMGHPYKQQGICNAYCLHLKAIKHKSQ